MSSQRHAIASSAPRPLLSRPSDTVWFVWFLLHLIIMFCVDMVNIYPTWLTPKPLLALREWYIATYNDPFFVEPPAWFLSFIWMEAIYHVPLSAWALYALKTEHPLVPMHLLIWSVQTFVTTLVCVVEILAFPGLTGFQLQGLCGLYIPYCILAAIVGLDMNFRISSRLRLQHVKQD